MPAELVVVAGGGFAWFQRQRAERRAHELEAPCVHLSECLRVIWQVGVHRVDDAKVVGVRRNLRINIRDPQPGPAMLFEGVHRPEQLRADGIAAQARRLAASLEQLRLVIEQIHMRRPTRHEDGE